MNMICGGLILLLWFDLAFNVIGKLLVMKISYESEVMRLVMMLLL